MSTVDVVLAAGPSVVALAAIGSAILQHRRSLAHERAMRVEAERHERGLHDLGVAREAIDGAATDLAAGEHAIVALAIRVLERKATEERERDRLESIAQTLRRDAARLAVLFGSNHPVVETCLHGEAHMYEAIDIARDAEPEQVRSEKVMDEIQGTRAAFLEAATTAVGAQLPAAREM